MIKSDDSCITSVKREAFFNAMDKNINNKYKIRPGRQMIKPKKEFNINNIPNIFLVLTVLLVNVLLIITIILISKKLPPQVPLYYGYPRGEKQLGSPISLILPLAISSVFIVLNSIFANFTKQTFLKNTLILGGFFASLLAVVTIIKIILLTISI